MLRLRTFGGLVIERDGAVLDQLSAQRKTLAVLAVLATAPASGINRDKLLALFWPESDMERARGALKQILHVLRRELGDVIAGGPQLRLDPAHIESDVALFRQAIATGDHEAAIRHYTGAFLDGVHIDEAAEFERWVDEQAADLKRAYGSALERAAQDDEGRNDWKHAADLWRRAYSIDPFNTRIAIGLISALDAAGDRAGALKLAREHDARLEDELGLPPDAALAAAVARLRTSVSAQGLGTAIRSPQSSASSGVTEPAPVERTVPVVARRARLPLAVTAGVAATLLIAIVITARKTLADGPELDPRRVAVAVFENRSGDPKLDRLGSVAADWVTRGITRSLPLRVLDEATLHIEGRTTEGVPTAARVLARRNGAGLVVSGNYYTTADSVYFSARVVHSGSGDVLRSMDPIGALLDDPLSAVEEMRQRITAALATLIETRESLRPFTGQPPRFDAYQEYVSGKILYWQGLFRESMPYYARAAELDSSFYVADVSYAVAAVGIGRCDVADSVRRSLEPNLNQIGAEDQIALKINSARCDTNWDEALRLQRERAALLPGSSHAAWPAAAGARRGNRPAEALTILEPMNPTRDLAWISDRDKMFFWREVTAAHHVLGDHRSELRTIQQAQHFAKDRLAAVYMHARALIAAGRDHDALRAIENVERLGPDPVIVAAEIAWQMDPRRLATPGWALHQLATEMLAHGESSQAPALLERADKWFRSRPAKEAASVEHRLIHARVLELLGQYDEAEILLNQIGAQDSLNLDYRGMLGIIAARRGNRDAAQRIDRQLAALSEHRPPGAPVLYRAQIAALLGDDARALDLLEALPYHVHPADPLFFHSDPAFLTLHGNPRFQAVIRPRG